MKHTNPSKQTLENLYSNLKKHPELDIIVDVENAAIAKGYTSVLVTCRKCNHSKHCSLQALGKSKYICRGCLVQKYKKLSAGANYEYISNTKGDSALVALKCLKCETISESFLSNLVAGKKPRCGNCFVNRYKEELSLLDCNYLGVYILGRRTKIKAQCRTAGHTFEIQQEVLTRGYGSCAQCRIDEYSRILAKRDCKFIEIIKIADKQSRVIFENSAGEKFNASIGCILNEEFAINNENHWRNVNSTYLIINTFQGDVYCKIGTSKCPEKRCRTLKLNGEVKVYVLDSFPNRFGADKLESELHKEFKQFKLDPEVAGKFTNATIKVKRKGQVERFYIKDGIHEWFTYEIYNILKTRYNLKEEQNGINSNTANQVNHTGQ